MTASDLIRALRARNIAVSLDANAMLRVVGDVTPRERDLLRELRQAIVRALVAEAPAVRTPARRRGRG